MSNSRDEVEDRPCVQQFTKQQGKVFRFVQNIADAQPTTDGSTTETYLTTYTTSCRVPALVTRSSAAKCYGLVNAAVDKVALYFVPA